MNGHKRELLRDIAEPVDGAFVDGPFGSNLKSDEYVEVGVRLIQLQNIGDGYWKDDNKKYITDRKFRSLMRHGAIAGDIAIAKMADPVARACIVPRGQEQYVVVADCIRLRVDQARFDPRYIVRAINSHETRIEAERKSIGSTRIRINLGTLKTVSCLVPPLVQQKAIAEILDTLDATIHQTEAIIEKLKQVKQGLLHDLLTRGIDANGELRPPQSQAPHLYKESPLGWIPREWALQHFGDLCESSAFGPRFPGDAYDADGPLATLRTTDMDDEGNIELSTMPRAAISPQAFAVHLLQPGDLVISRSGTCGVTGVFDGHAIDVVPGAFLIRFRLSDRRHAQFFRRYFNSVIGRPRLSRLAVGGVQKNIKGTDVLKTLVAVPPPGEAVACERIIDAHEQDNRDHRVEVRKLSELKAGLMDDLLTGRVRVTPLLA